MGIPAYFSYIVKNHTNILRKLTSHTIRVDNLYLDCNSIIYDAVYKIDASSTLTDSCASCTNEIIAKVIHTIKEFIRLLKPTHCVYIAFDGVAPVAKLEQQRSRRFKSLYQNTISKSIFKSTAPDPWNTTAITPGTVFMRTLNERIAKAFSDPNDFDFDNIIISGSDRHGEGEHKLFAYIREHASEHVGKNTVIYGLDADLIMLSINHLPVAPNIYLFRETPEFIKSIHADLEPNESYVLDIPELARTITDDMNNNRKGQDKLVNRVYDYIFLCFFLGNDFMPHFPAINIRTGGIDKMLQAYKATIGNTNDVLTNGKTIYWKNVHKLVQFLANNELAFLKEEHKTRDRREKHQMPDRTPEEKMDKFVSIPTYERAVEKYIDPYKANWQRRYYKVLFDLDIDDTRAKQICTNYVEGLEWTMKYYTTGCPDWKWSYQYSYPPLLVDLVRFMPRHNTEFIKNQPENPVTDLVQLCYVMPKQSLTFLPEKLYKALVREKLHWYGTDCEFHWAYCRYFWESHPNLPHIDMEELEAFVQKNK
jgi:5'-3' exoribonuclease 1